MYRFVEPSSASRSIFALKLSGFSTAAVRADDGTFA
jgi:hypothetical protein